MSTFYDWQVPGTWVEIYDRVFIPAVIDEWSPRLVEIAGLQPGEHVLDVACGTGAWARCAAARVGPHGHVVGLDINPETLAVARRHNGRDSLHAAIDWREGSADAIPLADAQFAAVCCQLGLMFFEDRVAALHEMWRVLVPDGRLVLMVWGRMEQCPGQMALTAAWTRHLGSAAAAGFYRQHELGDPAKVQALIAAAGYRNIEVQRAVGLIRFPTAAHLVRSYAAMRELQISPAVAEALIQDVTEALSSYENAHGLEYPIEAVLAQARK
jgi:ubiquinone/menaquinone biosynthesis C-methylase UbiE